MSTETKTPKKEQQTIAIYLNKGRRAEQRRALDQIAARFGLNRSQLIQHIADGLLTVTPKSTDYPQ